MTFSVEYGFAARRGFAEVPWPLSADVDGEVQRFARERAPHLPSGEYRLLAGGYAIRVRVNPAQRTVVVLYVFRLR